MEVLKTVLIVLLVIFLLLAIAFVLYKLGIISFNFITRNETNSENRQKEKLGRDEKAEEFYFEGKQVSVIKKDDNVVRILVSNDKETNTFGCQNGSIISFYSGGKEVKYKPINSIDRSDVIDEKAKFQEQIKDVDTELRIIKDVGEARSEDGNSGTITHKIKDLKSLKMVNSLTLELLEGLKNKDRTMDKIEDKEAKEKFYEIDSRLGSIDFYNLVASDYLNSVEAGSDELSSIMNIGSIFSTTMLGVAALQGIGAVSGAFLTTIGIPILGPAVGLGWGIYQIFKTVNGDDRADIKIQVMNNLSAIRKKKGEIEEEVAKIITETKEVQSNKRYRYLVVWLFIYNNLIRVDYSE